MFLIFSFLCLMPEASKSSYLTGDVGYDMYLREAHRQVSGVWVCVCVCVYVSMHVCLIKSTYLTGDVGYDMYLREAHRQVSGVCGVCVCVCVQACMFDQVYLSYW